MEDSLSIVALAEALKAGRNAAAAVTSWLDENVDPETGYVLDRSLTVSGAAADAKVTGDKVGELKSALNEETARNKDVYTRNGLAFNPTRSWLGNYTMNESGTVVSNSSRYAYVFDCRNIDKAIVKDNQISMYGWFASYPASGSTNYDGNRTYNTAVNTEITVPATAKYMLAVMYSDVVPGLITAKEGIYGEFDSRIDSCEDKIGHILNNTGISEASHPTLAMGQVSNTGAINTSSVCAYADITSLMNGLQSITFDSTKYKINLGIFNGSTKIYYNSWVTTSPFTIPEISEAYTAAYINVTKTYNTTYDLADAQGTTLNRVICAPYVSEQEVDQKIQSYATTEYVDEQINQAVIGTIPNGQKAIYPSGFVSRLKPDVYRSVGGKYKCNINRDALKISGGTTVYVATTGSDTNDGTEQSPFKTLTKALTVGTTIVIAAGTYNYGTDYARYCNLSGKNIIGTDGVIFDAGSGDFPFRIQGSCYVEKVKFKGGTYACGLNLSDSHTATFYKCEFCDSSDNALNVLGGNVYVIECSAHDAGKDGFNYHKSTDNNSLPSVAEIDCVAYDCGGSTDYSDNGSTTHDGASIVRVNGEYYNCQGGVVADSGGDSSSVHTYSCNFGVVSHGSTVEITGKEMFNASFWARLYTKMWLFDCVAYGSTYQISGYENAIVYCKNMSSDDDFNPTDYSTGGTIIRIN